MKTQKILFIILLTLAIAGTAAAVSVFFYQKDVRKLRLGQAYLATHHVEKAYQCFEALEDSLWTSDEARLGSIISGIILGRETSAHSLPDPDRVNIDHYPLLRLVKNLFAPTAFDRCRKLAEIAAYYGLEGAALYAPAVCLELGDVDSAARHLRPLSADAGHTVMGRNLREVAALLQEGARAIVRDRRGKLVGHLDREKNFHFYRDHYQRLIQPVIIANLQRENLPPGRRGIRLAVDLGLSRLAMQALGDKKGSIVLVEPESGDILAAVSDDATTKKMGADASPAFREMLEPASILKLITTTAAYRNNLDPDGEVSAAGCWGSRKYNGKVLWCPSVRGKLSGLDEALACSCNTAFADLGVKLGWKPMVEELRLFGFDSEAGNPFPLGKILVTGGDNRALADLSIGLENTRITPVHAALVASVFANGGYRVHPRLFYSYDGLTGAGPGQAKNIKKTAILEKEWLPPISDAMRAVTRYGGTAAYIAPLGFQVRMKTGTGGTYRDGFHINYIGHGPNEEGRIAFCVRVTGKRTSPRIRRDGYAVNKELLYRLKELKEKRGGRLLQ